MICPLCHSHSPTLLYPAKTSEVDTVYAVTKKQIHHHGNIVQCHECALAYVVDKDIVLTSEQSYITSPVDSVYETEQDGRKKTNRVVLETIRKSKPVPGRLLDVGCYTGLFVESAQQIGYDAYGIEPSHAAVAHAHKRGLDSVVQGTVDQMGSHYKDDSFDVITMFDVIEHVTNPLETIQMVKKKLAPGGLLVISTPDFSSVLSRVQKSSWHAIVLQHLYYFSKQNLIRLVEQVGFTTSATKRLTRYFSVAFLVSSVVERFKMKKLATWLSRQPLLKRGTIPVNLYDQLVLFAIKK